MLENIPGFLCGTSGSSGGQPRGEPAPAGHKGQGRAATCRSYTVKVKRVSDGKELSETLAPAYRSKKVWKRLAVEAQRRLIGKLKCE